MLHAVRMDSRSRNVLCRCAHTRVMYWAVSHVRYGPDAEISESAIPQPARSSREIALKFWIRGPLTSHKRLPISACRSLYNDAEISPPARLLE